MQRKPSHPPILILLSGCQALTAFRASPVKMRPRVTRDTTVDYVCSRPSLCMPTSGTRSSDFQRHDFHWLGPDWSGRRMAQCPHRSVARSRPLKQHPDCSTRRNSRFVYVGKYHELLGDGEEVRVRSHVRIPIVQAWHVPPRLGKATKLLPAPAKIKGTSSQIEKSAGKPSATSSGQDTTPSHYSNRTGHGKSWKCSVSRRSRLLLVDADSRAAAGLLERLDGRQ